ncbi:hypothetical protein PN498_23315 [Oscillatoria sp. CS-180]|uniref:hypothetical protein n=1 Tax=Oscillatoria sp. CS-180 TaxID=3021720 RepID=UPI00232ECE2F|nr:hypothetical protein [Oscillatoria sp. CS-180]MDB9528942.1 hypothetical protein [Oscillatoria sp. CS-180]
MARSLDQISKDLTKLETKTVEINEELKSLYQEYLSVLSKAVRQQLVLAVYHLCTQAYPDKFLQLSVNHREKVQASIRKVAIQGQTQIEQLGKIVNLANFEAQLKQALEAEDGSEDVSEDSSAQIPQAEPAQANDTDDAQMVRDIAEDAIATTEHPTEESSSNPTTDETLAASDENVINGSKEVSEMIQRLSASLSLFAVFGAEPLSPVTLAKRHVLLERHLRATLQTLSGLANYILKQVHILPDLPEMVIAAAAEAEAGDSGSSNTPNVLNVLVEMGGELRNDEDNEGNDFTENAEEEFEDNDDSDREMTHLVAINLRLADIEFADAHSALWRSRLQEALIRLKRLGSRYQKLQQEKARADAEHAWRATWFDE